MKHRRIDLFGHPTSLALENEFWAFLHEIADATGITLKQLIERIAAGKRPSRSLASEIRVRVTASFHGDPAVYRSDRRLVRARDGGLHVLSPRHASVMHLH
jgi:predicted DNA-binding ribbon-helix-helix protein